jgi:hypothetical protein
MATQTSSFTKAELRDIVRGDLGLRSHSLLTDSDLDRWANRAVRRVAVITHWYIVDGPLRGVTSGTRTYDLAASPNDVIAVKEVYHDSIALAHVSERWLDINRWNWRSEGNGTPQYYFLMGGTGISLHPIPDTTDVDILQVFYAAVPAAPAEQDDPYIVPVALEDYVEVYCKLQASLKDATGEGRERIAYYRGEVQLWEQRLAEFVNSMDQGSTIIVGGDNDAGQSDIYDILRTRTIIP